MVQLVKKSGSTTTLTQTNVYNQNGIRISRTQGDTEREYYYNNGVVSYTEDNNSLSSANIQNDDGGVIGTYRGSTYYNYFKNMQGSTESIISETGTTAAVYTYSDFGETEEVVVDSIGNEICYTGAIYDKDTGLYYMNARYYDAETGRFISQDSYRGEIDDAGTWHLYAYCGNNPVNRIDFSGYAWVKFDTIKKRAIKNRDKAKKVYNRYLDNKEYCNTSGVIHDQTQSKFKKIKFRNTNVKNNGCGIIAIHNLKCKDMKAKAFSKLVAEFDYNLSYGATGGIAITSLSNCLSAYGYKVQWYESRNNLQKNIKKSGKGIFHIYWNSGNGAHYVAVTKSGKGFVAYNCTKGYNYALYRAELSEYEKCLNGKIKRGYAIY